MSKLLKLLAIEWRSIVRHDNGGYTFSCKEFHQVSNDLEMMCRCHWKHIRELAEVICYYEGLFSQMVLKEVNTYLYPRSGRDLVGLQGLDR